MLFVIFLSSWANGNTLLVGLVAPNPVLSQPLSLNPKFISVKCLLHIK